MPDLWKAEVRSSNRERTADRNSADGLRALLSALPPGPTGMEDEWA